MDSLRVYDPKGGGHEKVGAEALRRDHAAHGAPLSRVPEQKQRGQGGGNAERADEPDLVEDEI